MRILYIFLAASMVMTSGCYKEEPSTHLPTEYDLEVLSNFPELNIPSYNPMTKEGVELGRKLYYDKRLSKNGDRSCSSCHIQSAGFSNPGTNVLPHINLGWNTNFLWNGKVHGTLEDIMWFEVTQFFETDIRVFNNDEEYKALFKKAYDVDVITEEKLAYALSQFFRTLISDNSPFDKFNKKEYEFTDEEKLGLQLFFTERGDCFHCHGSILLTDNDFHNIGLEANPQNEHVGLYEFTRNPADKGRFKTPTLRNVALRKSYMHDGRFKTLEEVIEHYNSGVQVSSTLDPLMYKLKGATQLYLTDEEKAALVAFLKTFTDEGFLTDPELSDPF